MTPVLRLSHPSPEPVNVEVTPPGGGTVYLRLEVPAGVLEVPYQEITFENAPAYQFRLYSPELGDEFLTDFRRTVRHLLISEVLLDRNNGFVELYNPTEELISLEGKQLVSFRGGDNYALISTFAATHAVEPRAYLLVGWGAYQGMANVVPSAGLGDLNSAYKLFLGTLQGNGKGMAAVEDALQYQAGWVHGTQSLERQAWHDATGADMQANGRYEFVGNAHDSDQSSNPDENAVDFVLRSPDPQNAADGTESFFLP